MILVEFECNGEIIAKSELHMIPICGRTLNIYGEKYCIHDVEQVLEIIKSEDNRTITKERIICKVYKN